MKYKVTRVILLAVLIQLNISISAIAAPNLILEASSDQVGVGDDLTLEANIEEVSNLFALSFELEYDPALLEIGDISAGDFLGNDTIDIAVPGDGNISVGISRKAGADGVDGSGVIAIVTLEAIAQGNSDITFNPETITLGDSGGNSVAGADSLETNESDISVQPPSLVPTRKLVKTWGYIKHL